MALSLTEERKVAWRIQGTGPDPAHWLVIFRRVGQGKILFQTLRPGQVFKRPFLASAEAFEAYAVSADENLRHGFSRKYLSGAQTWSFTLDFMLHFRVENPERLGLSLSDRDPLERLQEETANVLGASGRRLSWEAMKEEGEGFGLRLREAETADGRGEYRTNFLRLQSFAASLGLELRHLDVSRSLTERDLADEIKTWENGIQKGIARSDQDLAAAQEQLNHELQSLKNQNRIERELAIARSSQALQGMQRLRSILDAVAKGGVQAIHQSAGELRSFDAIHRALFEIQGIQTSLAGVAGDAAPALAPGAPTGALAGAGSGAALDLIARPGCPLESTVAEAFRHLRSLDENPRDQRRILASVLHLVAEAGLGAEADEEFLTGLRDDLQGRLDPVRSALPREPLLFLESILNLEGLRQRLS